ncbi:hypothetical protein GCM10008967_37910 [Bacillus carboniphilus]|uniref:Lipoprotein n=1 Tax=Bacillus carboniphilus TaxID=86663 RepID=A0ABP3GHZ6_9BACI
MSKRALLFIFLISLIGCSQKSDTPYYSSLDLEGYSNQQFEQEGVFIDPDSTLASDMTRTEIMGLIKKRFESTTYLIGSGVFRNPRFEGEQIFYDKKETPILIFFQLGLSQDLRGAGVSESIPSNGITIMQTDGEILKRILISAEHLQLHGNPILVVQ